MQVTPKKNTVISYLPQEIREATYTDIIYKPVTREMLEQLFSNSPKRINVNWLRREGNELKRQQVNHVKCCLYPYSSIMRLFLMLFPNADLFLLGFCA